MKHFITITLITVTLIIAGCGSKVSLTGKITFADNGEPLTRGVIFFTAGTSMAHATIQPDGTFKAGSVSNTDGLVKGQYSVRIALADTSDPDFKHVPDSGLPEHRLHLIDPKYEQAATSGLVVDVKGSTVYDFTVDRCPQEKQKFLR
jgi:hypothetical protein